MEPHFHSLLMYKTLKIHQKYFSCEVRPVRVQWMARPPEAESNPEPVVKKNSIIYHHLSSISTIRLCKEGKIDGPHFCKNQVPIIWQKDWIFLKKKKSFAVPQLVFKLCLIVPVISQIFMGQRLKKWSKGDRGRSCLHVGYRVEPCCGVSHLF